MKTIQYLLATFIFMLSMNSFAATRYVSDEVLIYLHSGPGLDYRITGTLKVGTKVNTLKYDESSKFMQVAPSSGRAGWIKASDLQKSLPAISLLPVVKKELKQALQKLKNITEQNHKSLESKDQLYQDQIGLIDNLNVEKSQLQQQILDLQAHNLELDLLQETKGSRVKMQWLLNGGGVLFFGLLIGLLIPLLPRRNKRGSTW